MVKGNQREQVQTANPAAKYVGLTAVTVKAVNPTRSELNKLLGKEDGDDQTEIQYLSQDKEGNDRVRLSFWLHDAKTDKYFIHSFNLTKKERTSRDGSKSQYINSTASVAWADSDSNLATWFTNFLDRSKNDIGEKTYRKAYLGEEELSALVRAWLGRMIWNDPNTSVMIDTDTLIEGDYSELRALIGSGYDTPFTILLGVRTDENDSDKHYQQIYPKAFLPEKFVEYIEKGFKFPNDYTRRTWKRFESEVSGEYGFDSFFKLEAIQEYNKDEDVASYAGGKVDSPTSSNY